MISLKIWSVQLGGSGSGSYYRYGSKETTEGLRCLDINWLNRNGNLIPGRWSSVAWFRGDKRTGSIGIRAEESALVLDYRWLGSNDEWETVTETIILFWTLCNYGGYRPWFVCPGVRNGIPCRRRVAKLFLAGKYFLCRHCYDLVFESQRESEWHRSLRTEQNIRTRLGGSSSITEPFPPKPKGMHWNTYLRLRNKAEHAELRYLSMLDGWLQVRM